jgi:hypothetical protein
VAKNASAAAAVLVIVSAVVAALPAVSVASAEVLADAVAVAEAEASAVDDAVAEDEDVVAVSMLVTAGSVVLQAAREPASVRAATEDAKRTQKRRDGERVEVVIGRVKGLTLSLM